jgi:hypothetical protein
MSKDTAELSSIEWSHGRQISLSTTTIRVIDRRDHTMGHEMSWLYELLQRLGEFPFQICWFSILPLKFFIVSFPCFLPTSLLSNLGMRFSLRGRVVRPHVTKGLIKLIKLQLSPNARLNQDTKVWNQIQRQRFKISSLFSVDRLTQSEIFENL